MKEEGNTEITEKSFFEKHLAGALFYVVEELLALRSSANI
jgi:hypothetical protein